MSELHNEEDKEEAALKWLALAVLHGINSSAKRISINREKGSLKVIAEYRPLELPNPGAEIGIKIFEAIRGITHIEGDKGKLPLALGVRDGSLDVNVKVRREGDDESVVLKFPE